MLTQERLRELFEYDPAAGVFRRLVQVSNCKAGDVAGCIDPVTGYSRIVIDRKHHWAHRLAWLYMTGNWPKNVIDHKNRQRADNRWDNLRDVTRAENLQNQNETTQSKTGERGIHWDPRRQKFKVEISVNNRNRFIGRFDDLNEARAARRAARAKYHPGAIL